MAKGIKVGVGRLQRFRAARAWSQAELSRQSGVSLPTISRIERGYPATTDIIEKLADALGVGPSRLTAEAEDTEKALLALIEGKADEVRAAVDSDEITTEMALRAERLHEDIERYAGPMIGTGPVGQAMDDLWSAVMEGYNASVRLAAGKEAEVRSMNTTRRRGGQRAEVKSA